MPELAIQIKDLKKSYQDVFALKGVNVDIPKGEFFGLLGPNGAGKTTTINIPVSYTHLTLPTNDQV